MSSELKKPAVTILGPQEADGILRPSITNSNKKIKKDKDRKKDKNKNHEDESEGITNAENGEKKDKKIKKKKKRELEDVTEDNNSNKKSKSKSDSTHSAVASSSSSTNNIINIQNVKQDQVQDESLEEIDDENHSFHQEDGEDIDDNNDQNELLVEGEDALTLESRLEVLSQQLNKLHQLEPHTTSNNSSSSSSSNSSSNPVSKSTNSLKLLPSAQSLVTLLDQALQSQDEALLEHCLSCSNLQMISTTTQQLPTHRVLIFLQKIVSKFEKRPTRGQLITQWLASILQHHLSYLITVPELTKKLSSLTEILEHRLQNHRQLVSLAGRLDLLMSQMNTNSQVKYGLNGEAGSGTTGGAKAEPRIIYEEND